MIDSRATILAAAVAILRDPNGPNLTLESAARAAGLTKPGLMYHFPTKVALVQGVIEYVMSQWVVRLKETLGNPLEESSSAERIAAYVDTVVGYPDYDLADLAVFFNAAYRTEMTAVWVTLMEPWITIRDDVTGDERSRLMAARLAADGFWFASAGGWDVHDRDGLHRAIGTLIEPADSRTRP